MGLGDIVPEEAKQNKYRQYPDHGMQERLERVIEENQDLFPGGVEVDFIEVSPKMTSTHGYGYHKLDSNYIRLAERVVENEPWYYVKAVILHEMVHIWMEQNNYDYSDKSLIFEWVCGYIGADITGTAPTHEEWEIIRKFKGMEK